MSAAGKQSKKFGASLPLASGLVVLAGLATMAFHFATPAPALPVAVLRVGGSDVVAEVAATPAAQERGLMGRTSLPTNGGMLFPLAAEQRVCLWMKDTPLPLSAAFIDAGGVVINIVELQPGDTTFRCALAPARFALEMPASWFKSRDVRPGDRVGGIEGVAALVR